MKNKWIVEYSLPSVGPGDEGTSDVVHRNARSRQLVKQVFDVGREGGSGVPVPIPVLQAKILALYYTIIVIIIKYSDWHSRYSWAPVLLLLINLKMYS